MACGYHQADAIADLDLYALFEARTGHLTMFNIPMNRIDSDLVYSSGGTRCWPQLGH
jgi:hypothetical protein